MSAFKKYRLNPETLLYEIEKVSARSRILKAVMLVSASFALSVVYLWLFTSVLGLKLPKTVLLERSVVLVGPFFVCGSSLSEFWVMGKTLAQRKIPVDLHFLVRTLCCIKRFF